MRCTTTAWTSRYNLKDVSGQFVCLPILENVPRGPGNSHIKSAMSNRSRSSQIDRSYLLIGLITNQSSVNLIVNQIE
jgi:hypothetical protein